MARAYSMDLRRRVLQDAAAGLSSKQLAERYHVSRAWVDALKQRQRETGDPGPRKQTRWRTPMLHAQAAQLDALIREAITATGAASLKDMGKVMGFVKPKAQGRCDMGAVSARIKSALGG